MAAKPIRKATLPVSFSKQTDIEERILNFLDKEHVFIKGHTIMEQYKNLSSRDLLKSSKPFLVRSDKSRMAMLLEKRRAQRDLCPATEN